MLRNLKSVEALPEADAQRLLGGEGLDAADAEPGSDAEGEGSATPPPAN